MNIENLVRERVIGNIKIGAKGENGIPKKLSYFNVEKDKSTEEDMVDIFKQLYPGEPTKLKIRFTSENPFNFKFKRYVNNKAVCIGNGTKAITIGKDSNGRNSQIEVECNEECQHLKSGKCKLKGSLKFKLDGIEAGGVWNLSTTGGISLSNIASEIVKYKKAGMSIVDVPFELTLTEQESLAYGTYYSIDLHRTDIKPQIVTDTAQTLAQTNKKETKQLTEETKKDKKETTKTKTENMQKPQTIKQAETLKNKDNKQDEYANYFMIKSFTQELINGKKFDKIIFEDMSSQEVEYILHPKTKQDILHYSIGSFIEIITTKLEMDKNVLCQYELRQIKNPDGTLTDANHIRELKEAA